MIKGVYGFNVAVRDLSAATETYEKFLGLKGKHLSTEDFAFPNLVGTEFDLGGVKINLIASLSADTSIAKFIEKKGEGFFLVSLEVSGIENEMTRLKNAGMQFVSQEPFSGSFGKVNFIHPKSANGVQFEILELATK